MQLSVGYLKPGPVATSSVIAIPPATGIDVVSTVATAIATLFATVVVNAVTNATASAVAPAIFTDIANVIDIPVQTVGATAIVTVSATALGIVVVAIVAPQV